MRANDLAAQNVPAECTLSASINWSARRGGGGAAGQCAVGSDAISGSRSGIAGSLCQRPVYKLVTYWRPAFANAPPTAVVDLNDGKGWRGHVLRAEHWAALVDRNNHGVGIFNAEVMHFGGGFAGKPKGGGGPKDSQTSYIAPTSRRFWITTSPMNITMCW